MIDTAAATTSAPEPFAPAARRPLSGVLKCAAVTAFLFVTGGPSVIAQYDDNAATYWRQERQRVQARAAATQRPAARAVEQRPTRLIRGAAPKKGFSRVVPHAPAPAGAQPGAPQTDAPAAVEPPGAPATPATPGAPSASPVQQAIKPPEPAANGAPAIRIVVMGDNVGQLLARGLEQAYAETPQIAISRQTRDSSGLVNNRFFDWNDAAGKMLASGEKIDIAVMMLGSNDAQEMQDGKERHRVRTDPWVKAYKARIEAIATQFRDKKIPLVWVGMPIMRGERLAAEMLAINDLYRDAVQKAGGTYIDIWEAFVDDRNRFTLFGPDVNGQIVKLRAGDGVHFTPPGARKLAYFLEAPLKRLIDERRPRTDPVIAAIAPAPGAAPVPPGKLPPPAQTLPAAPAVPPANTVSPPAPAEPVIAALPPQPKPLAAPQRAAAGPVTRLNAQDISESGELVTSRRKAGGAELQQAAAQSAFVQKRLVDGAPLEAEPGRADDFTWPRR